MISKIIYASDSHGIDLKDSLVRKGYEARLAIQDIGIFKGSPVDYIDISKQLAEALRHQPDARGVIIGGSGQGVAIVLNRFTPIRACHCRTVADAVEVRGKLNANVLCLGSQQNSFEESSAIVEAFISTPFTGGKHTIGVQKLSASPSHHASQGVNLIVRAMIIHDDHILLTTATASNRDFAPNLYFLPGGHVDYNEPCLEALKRELLEEMAVTIEQAELKGVLECSWHRCGQIYHELNAVYLAHLSGLDLKKPPPSIECCQTFVWVPVANLPQITLLPETLKPLIRDVLNDSQNLTLYSEMKKHPAD
ncbi:RpiB/LacA/LacB family sugar-phosphate isomerase [unidentified bacterial endosymbiont]|uniref:RpiB/LacA/LacB family sugar-phosphate isomerase n=1 Tax=unidentified bacterial endosymbiont TaxID=2355 RepID=UPI00209EA75B|nr:RpiB/LacA/LacB family sugar-phosphate isomerase [unidentified bacterial endosymbiont]